MWFQAVEFFDQGAGHGIAEACVEVDLSEPVHCKVHTFGVRNIKSGLPITVDDRMRIASISKAFSGAVALSLVRRSVTVSINALHTLVAGSPVVFEALRRAEELAVCAALAD